MKQLIKSATLIAIGAMLGIASYQLVPSALSQSGSVDPHCQATRMQVPTINGGLEWKRLNVCNDIQ